MRHRGSVLLELAVAGAILSAAPSARAGSPPNLLDDNRGNLALAATESTLMTTAVVLLGLPVNPLILTPVPVILSGRTLAHPSIHNLYWDDHWDGHNPGAPTSAQLDAFTSDLAASHYFDPAGQYGVGGASFTGSHGSSLFCLVPSPGAHAEFVEILLWASCEVSFDPFSPLPGLLPPITGVPKADDDSLYVVYLPRESDVIEGGCGSFAAYHFFGAVPNTHFEVIPIPPFVIPVTEAQSFAFAVVATKCAQAPLLDAITATASHEIIEAATDPLVGLGWINDTVVTQGDLLSHIFDFFNNVSIDLKVGEAADICEEVFAPQRGPPAFQNPTPPVRIAVSDPVLEQDYISVATYWSNNAPGGTGACVPFVPVTELTVGTPQFPTGSPQPFITSATPLTLEATDGGSSATVGSISFRIFRLGDPPPSFTVVPGASVTFHVNGADGTYQIDFFAQGTDGVVEAQHSARVVLDDTPPVITINQPTATAYVHSATLTLDYSVTDGAGSGVGAVTPLLDGAATLAGHGLASGQVIHLLTELALGAHTFTVGASDHLGNASTPVAVTFTIIVTPDSIKDDVTQFFADGKIRNQGLENSLLAKLDAAAAARARGNCNAAGNIYAAFIHELMAQSGKGVDATAAAIMIADAQYLIDHCP